MKKHLITTLKCLVAAACLFLIFKKIGFAEVMEQASHMSMKYFFIALALGLANRFLMAWRWYLLLRARNLPTPYMDVVRIIFVSNFVGMLVPVSVGVDAIRLYQIQKVRKDISNTTGSLVADRIISILMLCLFSISGILLSWNMLPEFQHQLRILLIICLVLLAVIYVVTANWTFQICSGLSDWMLKKLNAMAERKSAPGKVIRIITSVRDKATTFHEAISELIQNPRSLIPVGSITALVQLFRVGQIHFLFRGLDAYPAETCEFAFIPIIILLSLLPISPLGLGIKEGAFVFFFQQVGIEPSVSVATSLFTHVIMLLSITPGAYFFLATRPKEPDSSEQTPETEEDGTP